MMRDGFGCGTNSQASGGDACHEPVSLWHRGSRPGRTQVTGQRKETLNLVLNCLQTQ